MYGHNARIFISAPTEKCSHHRGYEQEGTAPSVLRSHHVRSPMTFVCSGARHTRDFSFLPKRHQITPYFVGVDLSTMRPSESDHSHGIGKIAVLVLRIFNMVRDAISRQPSAPTKGRFEALCWQAISLVEIFALLLCVVSCPFT